MIKASDARGAMAKKRQIKKDTLKAVLESFMRKIKVAIEAGKTSTVLEMPMYVTGFPPFDREKSFEYLIRQLGLLGYLVNQISPFMVFVSWANVKPAETPEPPPPFSSIHELAGELRRKNHR